jgi:hypothetical protein
MHLDDQAVFWRVIRTSSDPKIHPIGPCRLHIPEPGTHYSICLSIYHYSVISISIYSIYPSVILLLVYQYLLLIIIYAPIYLCTYISRSNE